MNGIFRRTVENLVNVSETFPVELKKVNSSPFFIRFDLCSRKVRITFRNQKTQKYCFCTILVFFQVFNANLIQNEKVTNSLSDQFTCISCSLN